MFHPDWTVLVSWLVLVLAAWIARGAIAGHRKMVADAQWEKRLAAMHEATAIWVVKNLSRDYGFSGPHAACGLVNTRKDLGPAFAQEFGLRWNAAENRWLQPRGPRQTKTIEPKVDLREESD